MTSPSFSFIGTFTFGLNSNIVVPWEHHISPPTQSFFSNIVCAKDWTVRSVPSYTTHSFQNFTVSPLVKEKLLCLPSYAAIPHSFPFCHKTIDSNHRSMRLRLRFWHVTQGLLSFITPVILLGGTSTHIAKPSNILGSQFP